MLRVGWRFSSSACRLLTLSRLHRSLSARLCSLTPSPSPSNLSSIDSSPSIYRRISPIEHILLRPETYIGPVVHTEQTYHWIFNGSSMVSSLLSFPPGLLKIFDELIVNAADNKQRDQKMKEIRVTVDRSSGFVSVWNDGRCLPIQIQPEEEMYIPTLIFGHLMTSSNFDDSQIRTVGGRNGLGAKLCNIFSKTFTVRTASGSEGKLFEQTWKNNMQWTEEPTVTNYEGTDFTEISFLPDFSRFGISEWTDSLFSLLYRRTIDISGTLEGVNVYFNGQLIGINNFKDYVNLFLDNQDCFHQRPHPNWEIAVSKSDGSFQQMSFVNNINTSQGGRHVEYVSEQLVDILQEEVEKRVGRGKRVRGQIRNHLFVFVNSLIHNPSFDSQTKSHLSTQPRHFGSSCTVDRQSFIDWANRNGLIDEIVEELERRQKIRPTGGKRFMEISKLEDANLAGGKGASDCTLIVTEGDSAKALAVAGLEVVGRDHYGVFPIRGKLMNVSDVNEERVFSNAEIASLCSILDLKREFSYETKEQLDTLRYGKLMILADQDEDGSHIKALLINFIHHFWPQLLKNGFVCTFVTPLLKARRGNEVINFYSQTEYKRWREKEKDADKWTLKYYKGLGTSSASEARVYFSALSQHIVPFIWKEGDTESIERVFQREKTSERKKWIEGRITNLSSEVEPMESDGKRDMTFTQFIDNQLIHFSLLDLRRSIPSCIDGLKPSQRKVLHTCFSSNRYEWKVSQLAGAVAQHQNYHHGEESLVSTIIRLCQSFVGSNNIPLLLPNGQFGTRSEGGADAASARYIFTGISPVTRCLFREEDSSVLDYINEENQSIEPKWFCPIVPLVLINGCEGIGTGWSTRILGHDPLKVIENMKRMIEGKEMKEMIPWFRHFTGDILPLPDQKFIFKGKLDILPNTRKNSSTLRLLITELPIGVWTRKYKERVLHSLQKEGILSSFSEKHKENSVLFELELRQREMEGMGKADIEKMFKLSSTVSMNNMILFDSKERLRKFVSPREIMEEFYETRWTMYEKRREKQKEILERQRRKKENQYHFVSLVVNGEIKMAGKTREEVETQLATRGIEPLGENPDYSYLLRMPVLRLCREELSRLESDTQTLRTQVERVRTQTVKEVWGKELNELEMEIHKHYKTK